MHELRELRVQLLLIACLGCLLRLGFWAFFYFGVHQWLVCDGPRILLYEVLHLLN